MRDHRLRLRCPGGQEGQGLVEYALILILVSVAAVIILITMGRQVTNNFANVVNALR